MRRFPCNESPRRAGSAGNQIDSSHGWKSVRMSSATSWYATAVETAVSKILSDGSMPPAVPALITASALYVSMRIWAAIAASTLHTPLYSRTAGRPQSVPS